MERRHVGRRHARRRHARRRHVRRRHARSTRGTRGSSVPPSWSRGQYDRRVVSRVVSAYERGWTRAGGGGREVWQGERQRVPPWASGSRHAAAACGGSSAHGEPRTRRAAHTSSRAHWEPRTLGAAGAGHTRCSHSTAAVPSPRPSPREVQRATVGKEGPAAKRGAASRVDGTRARRPERARAR